MLKGDDLDLAAAIAWQVLLLFFTVTGWRGLLIIASVVAIHLAALVVATLA